MENRLQTLTLAGRRAAKARVAAPHRRLRRIGFNVIVVTAALLLTAIAMVEDGIFPSSPTQALSNLEPAQVAAPR
jgi:hypothetical protein